MKYLAILRGGALKRGPPPIFPLSADPLAVESSWNAITPCRRASRVSSCLSSPSFHLLPSTPQRRSRARATPGRSMIGIDRPSFPLPLFSPVSIDRSVGPISLRSEEMRRGKEKQRGGRVKVRVTEGGGKQSGCGLSRAKIDDR